MTTTETVFYAIYDTKRKKFKGRGNGNGVRWSDDPTQTYDTHGKAVGALKAHIKIKEKSRYSERPEFDASTLIVIPVTVSWSLDNSVPE